MLWSSTHELIKSTADPANASPPPLAHAPFAPEASLAMFADPKASPGATGAQRAIDLTSPASSIVSNATEAPEGCVPVMEAALPRLDAAMGRGGSILAAVKCAPRVALAYARRCCQLTPGPPASARRAASALSNRLVDALWPFHTGSRVPSATTSGGMTQHSWDGLVDAVSAVLLDHLLNAPDAGQLKRALSRLRRIRAPSGSVVGDSPPRSGGGSARTMTIPLLKADLASAVILARVSPASQLSSLARAVAKCIHKEKSSRTGVAMVVQVRVFLRVRLPA